LAPAGTLLFPIYLPEDCRFTRGDFSYRSPPLTCLVAGRFNLRHVWLNQRQPGLPVVEVALPLVDRIFSSGPPDRTFVSTPEANDPITFI